MNDRLSDANTGRETYAIPLMPKGTLQLKKHRPISR